MSDIEEIDKIVFEDTVITNLAKKTTSQKPGSKNQTAHGLEIPDQNDPYEDMVKTQLTKDVIYQEEDSYINPSNVSKVNNSGFPDGLDISMTQNKNQSRKLVGDLDAPYRSSRDKDKKMKMHKLADINNSLILLDGENAPLEGSQIIN